MSTCPSVAELVELLSDSESGHSRADLEAHLSACSNCQNALLGLADDTGEWSRVQQGLKRGAGEARPGEHSNGPLDLPEIPQTVREAREPVDGCVLPHSSPAGKNRCAVSWSRRGRERRTVARWRLPRPRRGPVATRLPTGP